jgi:hypothetical protein
MGNSTIKLQDVIDWTKAKGIPVPTDQPTGYGTSLAIKLGNDVMGDIVAERFNWKWNRATAIPFYTNSYQQDYPQIGLTAIGWLEDADRIDINNTSIPKPLRSITVRRQLSRTSYAAQPVDQLCWMQNSQLTYGTWPGAGVTFNPLISTQVKQNPIMSMIDANGNRLVLTTFGTTGLAAPVLPASSAEGLTITDGTAVWTVVSPDGQGFRVFPLPGATGPVYQLTPYYQAKLQAIATLNSLLNPIPNDYIRLFQVGYDSYCLQSSPNPADQQKGARQYELWIKAMLDMKKQGDREADAYAMLPATSPVEFVYGPSGLRNPQDPSQPY